MILGLLLFCSDILLVVALGLREDGVMTLFTGTLIVIAVLGTVGAAYVWWPHLHVGAKNERNAATDH